MDRRLFEQDSPVLSRSLEYARKIEESHIIVFSLKKHNLPYKNVGNLHIYPTNSISRWLYMRDAVKIGREILLKNALNKGDSVITTQDPFETGLVGCRLKKMFCIPLQIQIHTDFLSSYFKNSFLNYIRVWISNFTIPKADGIRVVSSVIADSVKKEFPDIKAKIAHVHK